MKIIICFVILNFVFIFQSVAAVKIINAEYSALDSGFWALAENDGKYFISVVSLSACAEKRRIDAEPANIAHSSKYISGYIIAGGSNVSIYDTIMKKKAQSVGSFTKPVRFLSESSGGEYIAASDSLSVEVFVFQKDKLEPVLRKEFTGLVNGVYPDKDENRLYVSESNGNISIWSLSGELIKNTDIGSNIKSFVSGDMSGNLVVSTQKGLNLFNKTDFALNDFIKGSLIESTIDVYSHRLTVVGVNGFTSYDIDTMRAISSSKDIGKIMKTDGGNFIALILRNRIKFFDTKLNTQVGEAEIGSSGVQFLPVKNNLQSLYPDADFITKASGGIKNIAPSDSVKICTPLSAMVTGVYSPIHANSGGNIEVKDVNRITIKNPNNVGFEQSIMSPSIADVREPSVVMPKSVSAPKNSEAPSVKDNTKEPALTIKEVKEPNYEDEMAKTNTPSWVANRKNLPKNNAVKNGANPDEAYAIAKKELKSNIARDVLKDIVNRPEIKSIELLDVKKRVLWQVASSVAISQDKAIRLDKSWVTPAGQSFVLAIYDADNKSLSETTNKILKDEIERWRSLGDVRYMTLKPLMIE